MWASLWSSWDWAEIQYEATLMQQFGLNSVRILVPYSNGGWNGPYVPADRLQMLEDLVNLFGSKGIRSCVTLFDWETTFPAVGTSTEQYHKIYIDSIVGRLKNNPYVFMWDVKNEPDHPANIGGKDDWDAAGATNKTKIVSWLQRMCTYVKSVDPNHPVSVGMRWYNNVPDVLSFVDIACFHSYWWTITKSTEIPTIKTAMGASQKPIIAQEFGWPSNGGRENCTPDAAFTDAEHLTFYQKEIEAFVYHNIAGCIQWMTFDAKTYTYNPCYSFEQYFGIWKYDYTLKPGSIYYRDNFPVRPFPTTAGGGTDTPPPPVTNISTEPGDTRVTLKWKNPSVLDFKRTVIRSLPGAYPATINDGALVADLQGAAGASKSYIHTGLANGVTLYYALWAVDIAGNVSSVAHTTATPVIQTGGDSCGAVRQMPDGAAVTLVRKTVAAVFSTGVFYIQEKDRSAGLRVVKTVTGLLPGNVVTLSGTVSTRMINGVAAERQLDNPTVTLVTVPESTSPTPLAMNNISVGGESVGATLPGIAQAFGLNNIGLLVKISGRVSSLVEDRMYVDDGSSIADIAGNTGIAVQCPNNAFPVNIGDLISVTGIVEGNIPVGGTSNTRLIHIRSWSDIQNIDS